MSFQEVGGYCYSCEKDVILRRKSTNHILHLLLSIITGGFWLIIWFLLSMKIGGWRCMVCGGKNIGGKQARTDHKRLDPGLLFALAIFAFFIFMGIKAFF